MAVISISQKRSQSEDGRGESENMIRKSGQFRTIMGFGVEMELTVIEGWSVRGRSTYGTHQVRDLCMQGYCKGVNVQDCLDTPNRRTAANP